MPGATPKNRDGLLAAFNGLPPGQQGLVVANRDFSLMLVGGRRSGKSHLSCLALVVYAVMQADALVWAVSPTQERTDELE